MNRFISKYFFYYPVTILNGEFIALYKNRYHSFQQTSVAKQKVYKNTNLENIVKYSIQHSAYYSQLIGGGLDFSQEGWFERIPFLTKKDLIKNIADINTAKSKFSTVKTTGGSTGEPVKLFKTSAALARERTATWRAYAWAGVGVGDKQARFWGVPHDKKTSFKAKLIDIVANRFRISAFNLSDESLDLYYQKLQSYQPYYLYGYVSAIHRLTQFCISKNYPPIKSLNAVITTSEVLSDKTRKDIQEFWGANVFNEYGCGEVGSIAHDCEYGRLHVMSDNLNVEIVDAEGNAATTGEIVVTDYFNQATPLIRYRVGDFASWGDNNCPCGRTLPVIEGIHGRAYDLIKTQGGRDIHPESIIYIFEGLQTQYSAFNQFQIIQVAIDRLEVRIIKNKNWQESIQNLIDSKIKSVIDINMNCDFIYCSEIEREKSGKMRVVKSAL